MEQNKILFTGGSGLLGGEVKQLIEDYRNYKVTCEKAKTVLGFESEYGIKDIIINLHENKGKYGDFEKDKFYNIKT